MSREILLDPSNRTKSLILLRHPSSGHQVEILTSDERAIRRANELRDNQNEPVGIFISARCVALGSISSRQRVFYIDQLVDSLDGLWGWKFKLGDVLGTFEVEIRLESIHEEDKEKALYKLEHLLDFLAISRQVGFYIQHYHLAPIRRDGRIVIVGPEERILPAVTPGDIAIFEASSSLDQAFNAVRGLRQAYIETTLPGRLSRLWATVEQVFGSEAERLLTKDEVKVLLACTKSIESFKNNYDRQKKLERELSDFEEEDQDIEEVILNRIKDAVSDPNRLSLINRNKRIAYKISQIMSISVGDAYHNVQKASKLRGKHVHKLSKVDIEAMEASEKFLQEALFHYLKQLGVEVSTVR